jgi:hypothetical protein
MALSLPPTAVIRVSRDNFDPARFAEVERMTHQTGTHLTPAISRLHGLSHYFAGASPSGSIVHVSIWESDANAQQMGKPKEMIVDRPPGRRSRGCRVHAHRELPDRLAYLTDRTLRLKPADRRRARCPRRTGRQF